MPDQIRDGGPAFPNTVHITDPSYSYLQGMSLRDYFAAHAPTEIPDWFMPTFPKPHPCPVEPCFSEKLQKRIQDWRVDGCFDLADSLVFDNEQGGTWTEEEVSLAKAYEEALSAWRNRQAAQTLEYSTSRYFLWRWHYADAMLAAREKPVQGVQDAT